GCSNKVFGGGYCKNHQYKRPNDRHVYNKEAARFKKENPFCMAKLDGCTKRTDEVHHKRGRLGLRLMDEKYWLPVCRNCHRQIEENPEMAKEKGFSESRLIK